MVQVLKTCERQFPGFESQVLRQPPVIRMCNLCYPLNNDYLRRYYCSLENFLSCFTTDNFAKNMIGFPDFPAYDKKLGAWEYSSTVEHSAVNR